jgi:hypothetical protein
MNISSVSGASGSYEYQATAAKQAVQPKAASAGDEATESQAAKAAEKANGGAAAESTGGIDIKI